MMLRQLTEILPEEEEEEEEEKVTREQEEEEACRVPRKRSCVQCGAQTVCCAMPSPHTCDHMICADCLDAIYCGRLTDETVRRLGLGPCPPHPYQDVVNLIGGASAAIFRDHQRFPLMKRWPARVELWTTATNEFLAYAKQLQPRCPMCAPPGTPTISGLIVGFRVGLSVARRLDGEGLLPSPL